MFKWFFRLLFILLVCAAALAYYDYKTSKVGIISAAKRLKSQASSFIGDKSSEKGRKPKVKNEFQEDERKALEKILERNR
jgi:hypothetical protein